MRNPLKKIQKKIKARSDVRQAKALQNSQPKSTADNSDSSTSLVIGKDDPLFNNRSSRLRLALLDSKEGNQSLISPSKITPGTPKSSTPKKDKKGIRMIFGSARKVYDKADRPGELLTIPTEESMASLPKRTLPESADRPSSTTSSPSSSSPSSNSHVPAPSTPKRNASTLNSPTESSLSKIRDKADVTPAVQHHRSTAHSSVTSLISKFQTEDSVKTPPRTGPVTSPLSKNARKSSVTELQQVSRKARSDMNRAAMVDPALERIAKAAAALDNAGNQLFEKGEYDKAMAHYIKALKLKNRSLGASSQDGEESLDSSKPIALEKIMPSIPEAKQAVAISKTSSKVDGKNKIAPEEADDLWVSVATSINNIGYLRQQSGQASADETMQAYQNSLDIKRRVLGKDNLSVGKTLNNLGTVHYLKREYDQALNAYQEALQIMMSSLGPLHLDVGTVHSNIGDVHWAQSGDSKSAEGQSVSQEEFYQASRNSALRHYRQSLEIRWEELHDHRDPKVIRLLEKIAALEMGESFLALVQSSRLPRPDAAKSPTQQVGDEEEEAAHGSPQFHREVEMLHEEVKREVKTMDMMERKMAIDMVKDKLRLIREMKKLSSLTIDGSFDDDDSVFGNEDTPTKVTPLSPVQREEALSAVKERLQLLRESRKKTDGGTPQRSCTGSSGSDLKEADGSPDSYFLSHRASEILNKHLRTAYHATKTNNDLDKLRNFSLDGAENKPTAAAAAAAAADGKEGIRNAATITAVSPRAYSTLGKGLDALRSLPINDNGNSSTVQGQLPWVISTSALATDSPEKSVMSPATPLPSASMSAF